MTYSCTARATSKNDASLTIKKSEIRFGTTADTAETLPNPAELFLGSLAACILKNVERFSELMNFEYRTAELHITATRLEKPPRMDDFRYTLKIHTPENQLNTVLLQKNIEKFGTIFNTVKISATISGELKLVTDQ
ncbi:OsmC family protein [Maribacter sp. X9]|uniref:OsmC family protein n=1 Tax=Maribacter sp. X9 TaxID=3402159 RepID=UPI003AF3C231